MSSGGGGGGGDSTNENFIRYAPYVEEHHTNFLDRVASYVSSTIGESPHEDLEELSIDECFLGAGFLLSDFPALFDMYGKFMAGLDVEVLADQMLEAAVGNNVIDNLVAAEADLLDDHVNTKILPKFLTGMRDINAVLSSTFVIGKANIAESQTKAIEKYSGELRYRMIPVAQSRWERHLDWNERVIRNYSEILRFYLAARIDTRDQNQKYKVKDALWPFTVLDFQRAALGALQGASNSTSTMEGEEPSQLMGAVGGGLSGAAAGSVFGAPGAIVGGVLGVASSFL